MKSQLSAKITLWCNRTIFGILCILVLLFPKLLHWYQQFRFLGLYGPTALTAGFYLCVPVVAYALYCIEKLIHNILRNQVFISENVRFVRQLRWCRALVSLICIPVTVFYLPLIFMVVIMAFLALVVSVVKNVLAAAVEIREENDLTV